MMTLPEQLQGKWFTHPLHPVLAHVPAGLWPAALVFDLITYFGPASPPLVQAGFWCVCGGLLGALAAIPTGLADWLDIEPGDRARTLGYWHMGLNTIVFCLFIASFCMRLTNGVYRDHVDLPSMVLCFIGVVILIPSAYLGGRMVYARRTGVGRTPPSSSLATPAAAFPAK